jgi:hypothetical protein
LGVIGEHAMAWCCLAAAPAGVDRLTSSTSSSYDYCSPCFVLLREIDRINTLGLWLYHPAVEHAG